MHDAVGLKTVKLHAEQAGNLWLVDLQDAGGTSLSEPPRANDSGDAKSKRSLGETLFRIWQSRSAKTLPLPSSTSIALAMFFRSFAPLQSLNRRTDVPTKSQFDGRCFVGLRSNL